MQARFKSGFATIAVIGVIAVVVLAAVGGGAYYYFRLRNTNATSTPQNQAAKNTPVTTANLIASERPGQNPLITSQQTDNAPSAPQDNNPMVSATTECSFPGLNVTIPSGWDCRKFDTNPLDVTLFTANDTLSVTIGKNAGSSTCSIVPGCAEQRLTLSSKFQNIVRHQQPATGPLAGIVEITGTYANDPTIKLLVVSHDVPAQAELEQVRTILDSAQ